MHSHEFIHYVVELTSVKKLALFKQ